MRDTTLVILWRWNPVSEVLLGYKKIGFGQGKYTGFGGKIEHGEGVVEAVVRELSEETGVHIPDPESLVLGAVLEFRFPHKRGWEQRVFTFLAHDWSGIPAESDEMIPGWFPLEDIPYDQMWDDAHHWLPLLLSGERFRARFTFNADNQTVGLVKFSPLQWSL